MSAAASAVLSPVVVEFGARAANDDRHAPAAAPVPTTFTRERVAALLLNGFAGATFEKADGSTRRMVFRLVNVGPERAAEDERTGNVTVYSMHDRGLRRIKLERLQAVRVAGRCHVARAAVALVA